MRAREKGGKKKTREKLKLTSRNGCDKPKVLSKSITACCCHGNSPPKILLSPPYLPSYMLPIDGKLNYLQFANQTSKAVEDAKLYFPLFANFSSALGRCSFISSLSNFIFILKYLSSVLCCALDFPANSRSPTTHI